MCLPPARWAVPGPEASAGFADVFLVPQHNRTLRHSSTKQGVAGGTGSRSAGGLGWRESTSNLPGWEWGMRLREDAGETLSWKLPAFEGWGRTSTVWARSNLKSASFLQSNFPWSFPRITNPAMHPESPTGSLVLHF